MLRHLYIWRGTCNFKALLGIVLEFFGAMSYFYFYFYFFKIKSFGPWGGRTILRQNWRFDSWAWLKHPRAKQGGQPSGHPIWGVSATLGFLVFLVFFFLGCFVFLKKWRGTQKSRYHATWRLEITCIIPRVKVTWCSFKKLNRILMEVPSGFICLPKVLKMHVT